ncbi:MAG: S-layer homology domain-containing protein [Oscillospiraceae bacterium]|nr:S-layer homology domain-containing protein [Oscillospiraceae bacterium]
MNKRFPALTLLLTFLLCVTVRAAAPRLEVHLPAGPVEAGEEFAVTVDLTGNPGILSAQFTLTFDKDRMECVEAAVGELLSQQTGVIASNPDAKSGAMIAAASMDVMTGDGPVGVFRFRAKEKLSDLHFSIERIMLSDRDRNKLDVQVTDAETSDSASGAASNAGNGAASSASGNNAGSGAASSASGNNAGSGAASSGNGANAGSGAASNASGNNAGSGAASNASGAASPANAAPPFTDIAGTWAESYIRTASERNLFQGYPDGTFRPDNRLTRAQFMMVLWNLAGRPAPSAQSPFEDMRSQIDNFQKAVSWAYEKGYVNGTSAATFSPGEPLTRQAAVKILFAYNGSKRGPEALLTQVYDEQYEDSGRISSWAKSAMYWAVYQTILSGTSPTTLTPGGAVTRAQLAAIMTRYTDRFPA